MSTDTIKVISNEPTESPVLSDGAVGKKADASEASAKAKAETKDDSETSKQEHDDTPAKEGEGGEEEEGDEGKPNKPKGGYQRKIDKLTRIRKQAEAERDAARAELEQLRASKVEQPKEQPKATGDGEPKIDDFESHADYLKALVKWERTNAENEAKAAVQKQKQEEAKKTEQERWNGVLSKYNESIEAAQEKFDDYDDVIDSLGSMHIPGHVVQYLYEAQESAGELSYALAKNKAELERISKLHPSAALRELAKFEAKHVSAPETKEDEDESEDESEAPKQSKKITKAPDPITPVGGSGRSQTETSIYDEGLSFKEFEQRELKRLAKKRA